MRKQLRRDHLVAIRLRRFEVEQLERAAAIAGEKRSEMVRRLLWDGVRKIVEERAA